MAITVFDLRFCVLDKEILSEKGIRTLGHLFAGFMRDCLNGSGVGIVGVFLVGCCVGFCVGFVGVFGGWGVAGVWFVSMWGVLVVWGWGGVFGLGGCWCGVCLVCLFVWVCGVVWGVLVCGVVVGGGGGLALGEGLLGVWCAVVVGVVWG
ncbi:S-ribosylhomocysteine lyase, partial [Neisseria sp. P0024.S006]|uniref:S-ribosylhomocysteine lyase n=1 Tax=Neisseria sp. P0024.S006 TaxID=3436850 RepID=UPI003F82050B